MIGVRILGLMSHVKDELEQTREAITLTAAQLQLTLQNTQAVLASVRATTEAVRRSATSQLGYYEAIGRRASQLLAEGTILIRHADKRLDRLTDSSEDLLRTTRSEVARAGDTFELSASVTNQTLASISSTTRQIEAGIVSAEIPRIANDLAIASQHLASTSASAEETIENINGILAPTHKGFWRRLLEAFIPRQNGGLPASSASK